MADESNRVNEAVPGEVETTDRGLFGFMKKKEDETAAKPSSDHDNIVSGVENVHLSSEHHPHPHGQYEEKKEEKHESLLDKLKHDDSSSSSSDEEGDDEEKKRRKKERKEKKKAGLKEKFEEKFGHKEEEHHHDHDHHGDTNVPIEKIHVQENVYSEPSYGVAPPQHIVHDHVHQEENKDQGGFMDKIKDKLPGQHKDGAETTGAAHAAPVVAPHHAEPSVEGEKEKKGFLDKIKDKIPGLHSKTDEEKKVEEEKKESHY